MAFPVELLPTYLMNLGSILPSTHFLELIRADIVNTELIFASAMKSLFVLSFSALSLTIIGVIFITQINQNIKN